MPTRAIKVSGSFLNADGGTVTISVVGPGISQSHTFHQSFTVSLHLQPGRYAISVAALSEGQFLLSVSGAGVQSIQPAPKPLASPVQIIYTLIVQ